MKILAYSKWDALPALCGMLHFAYVLTFFALFPVAPWWVLVCMGIVYSISVSWNINGISHNFIHNAYFSWRPINRMFGVMESMPRLVFPRHSTSTFIIGIIWGTVTGPMNEGISSIGCRSIGMATMARPRTSGATSFSAICVTTQSDLWGNQTEEPGGCVLGCIRDCRVYQFLYSDGRPELEVYPILSALLLPRALPLIPEWILPAFRRESG